MLRQNFGDPAGVMSWGQQGEIQSHPVAAQHP